jgi:hypothetical protein
MVPTIKPNRRWVSLAGILFAVLCAPLFLKATPSPVAETVPAERYIVTLDIRQQPVSAVISLPGIDANHEAERVAIHLDVSVDRVFYDACEEAQPLPAAINVGATTLRWTTEGHWNITVVRKRTMLAPTSLAQNQTRTAAMEREPSQSRLRPSLTQVSNIR